MLPITPRPYWLALHREIRANKAVRRACDFLAEAIPHKIEQRR